MELNTRAYRENGEVSFCGRSENGEVVARGEEEGEKNKVFGSRTYALPPPPETFGFSDYPERPFPVELKFENYCLRAILAGLRLCLQIFGCGYEFWWLWLGLEEVKGRGRIEKEERE